ncbi:uncharacterized protein [Elaeis guineensis]|uniref:uncharacterized protein n=1 Tax=Elaeis guineensis var. tenera TaxID=51953 RepID=UPI003C6D103A
MSPKEPKVKWDFLVFVFQLKVYALFRYVLKLIVDVNSYMAIVGFIWHPKHLSLGMLVDVGKLSASTGFCFHLKEIMLPDDAHGRDVYIVISGSTVGSTTFWDLTEIVECFMQLALEIQLQMLIDCRRQPQTVKGSQGGQWWGSMTNIQKRCQLSTYFRDEGMLSFKI